MPERTGPPGRRPRADAQRNRSHILDVAEGYFAEHGIAGSLDAIARRAGVGPGTLYRHFPNRDALLAALLEARNAELVSRRDRIHDEAADATEALERWLEALGDWVAAFDGLPEPLRAALQEESSPLAMTCEGFITTTDDFVRAARDEGGARPGVRGRDVFLGVLAMAWVRGAAMADDQAPPALDALLRTGWAAPADEG